MVLHSFCCGAENAITDLFLVVSCRLHAPVIYLPEITPAPSSGLRQLAYAENMGMAGPNVDPEGWHELPTVTMRGTIFRERSIKLHCTVSLAPLYIPHQLT